MTTAQLHLTRRELQILTLLANCKHNDEIAATLNVSPHTAKFHVNSILTKTGQTTRLGAVIYCLKLNVLNIKDLMPELNVAIAKGIIVPLPPPDKEYLTATAMAILEENKQYMEQQKQNMKDNIVDDIMESVDKLSMDFGNEQLKAEIIETLNLYVP